MKTVKGQIIEERDINNGPKNPEQAAAVQRETERVAQETQAALEILDGAAQRETERVARETQDALNRAAEDAKKECKTCKQSGLTNFQKGSVILGLYILISAIYGTVEFIKDIISYFKHVY